MGFRAIERIKGVHHTSIINWVKQVGELLPNAYAPETIPLVGELDELETFVGSKKAGASLGGSLPMKGAHKTQNLALDKRRSLQVRNFRMGIRRSSCENFSTIVGISWKLEMLFLYHRWMASLSDVYSRWRPNYL